MAHIVLDEWEEGARLTLDWGDVPNSVYSLWNANFADKNGERGPRLDLVLPKQAREIGIKMRGQPYAVPRLHCLAKPRPPPPGPKPPPLPSPPSPPSPQGCESSNTFADHASLKTAVAEYDYRPHVAREKYGAIAGWCVWGVTDMNGLFMNMHRFNQDISDWDTSRVTAMDNMFNVRFPPRSTSQTALAAVALPPTRPAARPAPSVCPVLATLGRTRASSTGPCAGTPPASRPWTTCFT